jgi:hypothetical protein
VEFQVNDYIYVFGHERAACYCDSCWRIWFCEEGAVDLVLC